MVNGKRRRATFSVARTDHLWITMSDGTRLAARLWRPVTAEPVPAIVEYIPYRKTDMVRARDERNHPFFAAHGYAAIRVDMRGSGDSEGDMPDMYAPAELDDACQVIHWLATQPWCNGHVGMFGTSWGGTAALQANVDAPGPLKAVIAVCATHDRFEDDIHYMGGCVLSDTFEWGATLPAILASPPTPAVGDDWQDRWIRRIENLSCPLENWLRERGRGSYWRHGSVIHQADRLTVPILAVGGWSDRYSNSVMALSNARPDLVWGVVGPWGHHYPDHGSPGPAMGFQQVALQWWDHHLNGPRPDPIGWPRLRVWQRRFDPPHDRLGTRAGAWIETPPAQQSSRTVTFGLGDMVASTGPWEVPTDPSIGMTSGDTGYFGRMGGLPSDPSPDDARSLVFETPPLAQDLMLHGAPLLKVAGTFTGGTAPLVVRLSDVAPDGTACRISYGLRNLALDDALDLQGTSPDRGAFDVAVPLHSTAYLVRRGHRLRIALSSSLWPFIWPAGDGGQLTITGGALDLPELCVDQCDLQRPLPEPEDLPEVKSHTTDAAPDLRRWQGVTGEEAVVGWHQPATQVSYREPDITFGYETRMVHKRNTAVPLTEVVTVDHSMAFLRPDGTARIRVSLEACAKKAGPEVTIRLSATWNDKAIGQREWHIPSQGES